MTGGGKRVADEPATAQPLCKAITSLFLLFVFYKTNFKPTLCFQEEKASLLHRTQEERRKREVLYTEYKLSLVWTYSIDLFFPPTVWSLMPWFYFASLGWQKTAEKCDHYSILHTWLSGFETAGTSARTLYLARRHCPPYLLKLSFYEAWRWTVIHL